ncbi:MAG: tRNA(Ile)-lysidine synthase [Planctomycetota bacterium]|jgi:tRNA(Ile)-lysidine synthase
MMGLVKLQKNDRVRLPGILMMNQPDDRNDPAMGSMGSWAEFERDVAIGFARIFSTSKDDYAAKPLCLVAVSGGPDSVFLLHLLRKLQPDLELVVAHMNHHARPDSDLDQSFVEHLAYELGLRVTVGHWVPRRESHFESDARTARHDWLCDTARQFQADYLATAHTMDDQAETLLLRIIRGTGPHGLSGIRHERSLNELTTRLVRPILGLTKQSILNYLNDHGLGFRIDPTNRNESTQSRAWVRHVLIPQISQRLNPEIVRSLNRLAELSAEEQDGLDALATETFRNTTISDQVNGHITINRSSFISAGPEWLRRRWLRLVWSEMRWPQRSMTMQHWLELEKVIAEQDELLDQPKDFPGGIQLTLLAEGYAKLTVRRSEPALTDLENKKSHDLLAASPAVVPLPWPGKVQVQGLCLESRLCPGLLSPEQLKKIPHQSEAVLDAARLEPPLYLRYAQIGDLFDPLGMGGHHQKLMNFLRIQKIPEDQKEKIWLVCDQAGIVWVVGYRIAHRVRCDSETENYWHLYCQANSEPLGKQSLNTQDG